MGRMRLSVQFLLRPLKRTRRSQCPWRAAARRVPVCARAAWSWRAPSGRSRPGPRRCGPLGNRAHRVGPRRRGARPPGASGGSNISPITAAWSKWAGVSRCRASTTANHGSVSPIRTSLSPSRNGPSTPRRTSAAIRRTPRRGSRGRCRRSRQVQGRTGCARPTTPNLKRVTTSWRGPLSVRSSNPAVKQLDLAVVHEDGADQVCAAVGDGACHGRSQEMSRAILDQCSETLFLYGWVGVKQPVLQGILDASHETAHP